MSLACIMIVCYEWKFKVYDNILAFLTHRGWCALIKTKKGIF